VNLVFFLIIIIILSFAIELLSFERVLLNIIWKKSCTRQRVMNYPKCELFKLTRVSLHFLIKFLFI
jgi:hypothetical protein